VSEFHPGQLLQRARLEQGLDTASLAKRLHMRSEQIDDLESGDPQRWPERAFAIAQVRRLAGALQIDADVLVAGFQEQLEASDLPIHSSAAEAVMQASEKRYCSALKAREEGRRDWISQRGKKQKPSWQPIGIGIALLVALGAFALLRNEPAPKQVAKQVAKPVVPASVPRPQALELELVSVEPVWLAVRAQGKQKLVFEGNFQGKKLFPLGKGLELRSGRPDLVKIRLGDQPAKALGSIDRIEWVSIKPPAAAPAPRP
jgi:transcriptional regulator with XRE-family HTH domain